MIRTTQAESPSPIKVIIGLGNPGAEYEYTYHNAGALSLAHLAAALSGNGADPAEPLRFKHYKNDFDYISVGGMVFVRPRTFMNESGLAVKSALHILNVSPEEIAVVHDDSDLAIGTFKIVRGGGAAGHKGILSIVDHIGTQDFLRIRIGVRDPQEMYRKKAGDFVLDPISPEDRDVLDATYPKIAAELHEFL